jgi:hypothetical protein
VIAILGSENPRWARQQRHRAPVQRERGVVVDRRDEHIHAKARNRAAELSLRDGLRAQGGLLILRGKTRFGQRGQHERELVHR